MKRNPGRWRHVRYLKTSLTLEQLGGVMQERFKWPDFEFGTNRGRRLASLDLGHLDVLITELPDRPEEYNFQIHLTLSREEGMIGQVLLERWQALLDQLDESEEPE